jgi:hypothetical protein
MLCSLPGPLIVSVVPNRQSGKRVVGHVKIHLYGKLSGVGRTTQEEVDGNLCLDLAEQRTNIVELELSPMPKDLVVDLYLRRGVLQKSMDSLF